MIIEVGRSITFLVGIWKVSIYILEQKGEVYINNMFKFIINCPKVICKRCDHWIERRFNTVLFDFCRTKSI